QQLNTTTEAWKKWVQSCRLPSKYQEEVIRSALTLKLHQYTPTGAFTAATTTSLPEDSGSERNWDYRFCWPRDSYFTATVFHRLGKLDEVGAYIDFLSRLLDTDVTNRFQPIYGIDGERDLTEYLLKHLSGYQNNPPVRIGNAAYDQVQNDLYGQLIMSIAPLCFEPTLQTADRPFPKVLLEELLCQIEQRLEQPDAGLWEFRTISQVHSYTLLTHWKGAQVTKQIAAHKQWKELEKKADQLEQQARTLLQQKCWNEEKGAYMSDYTQRHMDGSLYMLVHWDFHPQADPRNHRHLRSLEQALAGKHRLMFRYKHADDFEQPSKATFTICSFWYVEALAKLGYRDKAQKQFDFLISCANPHGLFSED
ncbi:MAG: glycoside hydrolase family 15 protein, partial [Myxococcota bacterium]